MGLVESKLIPELVKPLVRADTITPLPSLTIDSCKFTNGSFGFLIKATDLAKNTTMYTIQLKNVYSPNEGTLIYHGMNQSFLTFIRDRYTKSVICILNRPDSSGPILCNCVSIYESIGDEQMDRLATLFTS